MALQAPTFAGTALCTRSQRQVPGSIAKRILIENLPGADGEYAQTQGSGGRDIVVIGILHTTAKATRILALTAAYEELRAKEDLAGGASVATYVDPAGLSITNCLLMHYSATTGVEIVPVGDGTYKGVIGIRAIIHELSP